MKKLKKNDYLIITGDFGFFWNNSRQEIENLKFLMRQPYKILFVDGTHENFNIIENPFR